MKLLCMSFTIPNFNPLFFPSKRKKVISVAHLIAFFCVVYTEFFLCKTCMVKCFKYFMNHAWMYLVFRLIHITGKTTKKETPTSANKFSDWLLYWHCNVNSKKKILVLLFLTLTHVRTAYLEMIIFFKNKSSQKKD